MYTNVWNGQKWVRVALGQVQQPAPKPQTGAVQTSTWTSSPIFWMGLGAAIWAFREPLIEFVGVGEAAATKVLRSARQKIGDKSGGARKEMGAAPKRAKRPAGAGVLPSKRPALLTAMPTKEDEA
jgi:hypothetical protein